jgi:hypothetical protein
MKNTHKIILAFVGSFLISVPLDMSINAASFPYQKLRETEKELQYHQDAERLNDLLFREGTPVHMQVVIDMLKNIDKNLDFYYPNGPFTRNDFIALAWVESEFKQYEGGTHGEKGIFQIMPDEFKDFDVRKNYYNVDINTTMAFRVLDEKYRKHKDYKKAIIAYNGLVYHKGKLSEKYWKAFEKRKIAIDLLLGQN